MTKDETKEINDLANELCHERIKFSPLWDSMKNNAQIDAKAEDFAALLLMHLEDLIYSSEAELERENEGREAA